MQFHVQRPLSHHDPNHHCGKQNNCNNKVLFISTQIPNGLNVAMIGLLSRSNNSFILHTAFRLFVCLKYRMSTFLRTIFSPIFPTLITKTKKQPGSFVLLWRRGGSVLTAGHLKITRDARFKIVGDYNLQIAGVRTQDAGDYICQIGDQETRDQVHTVEILGRFCLCVAEPGTITIRPMITSTYVHVLMVWHDLTKRDTYCICM